MYHDDFNYCQKRLSETIVKTRLGVPVYISRVSVNQNGKFICSSHFPDGLNQEVPLDDIDLVPVELGYVNINHKCGVTYVSRVPIRNGWKQGLAQSNISFLGPAVAIPSSELFNTIQGVYPRLKSCVENLSLKFEKRAFSRQFAISNQHLFYKEKIVGFNNAGRLSLEDKYEYLNEDLQRVL